MDQIDQLGIPDEHVVPRVSRLRPTRPAVTVSKEDLSREEMDEMIRNIGKGIFPG